MLNVLRQRKNLLCYKPKYGLSEEKNKNPVSLYIQSTISFKSQNFRPNLKLPLSNINTISKKQLCCHLN